MLHKRSIGRSRLDDRRRDKHEDIGARAARGILVLEKESKDFTSPPKLDSV